VNEQEKEKAMTTKALIESVLSQKSLAVAGVSRDRNKFGNMAYRALKAKGYRVLPINPNVQEIEGDLCYPPLEELPEKVGGLIVVTQPAVTEQIVRKAADLGITKIWLQQGSESPAAIRFCMEHNLNLVSGECIMMYMPGTAFPHKIHKFIKETLGGRPA
jgi:uncharacterized protein